MRTRSLSPWWKAGAKGGSFSKPLLSNSSHSSLRDREESSCPRDAQAPGDGQPRERCGCVEGCRSQREQGVI